MTAGLSHFGEVPGGWSDPSRAALGCDAWAAYAEKGSGERVGRQWIPR
jgi:hypothetical protein